MKKIIACMAMLCLSSVTMAETDKRLELCAVKQNVAKLIMDTRQMGLPMGDILALVDKDDVDSKTWIVVAYKQPRVATDEEKEYAAVVFSEAVLQNCLGEL